MLKSKWCILLLFLILGLGIYSTSLNNGFIFSDHYLIAENCLIRSSSFTPYYFLGHISQDVKGAFRPLFMLSYNLSYSFSNYNTLGYRIFNILLHALSAFFLYRILCLFFKEPDSKIALLLSIFFLVHPINLDAVVHIMARSTLLFSFFILLSFHFFLKYSLSKAKHLLYLSVVFYLAAALTKEHFVLYLPILFSYILLFGKRGLKKFICLAPYLLISISIFIYWKIMKLAVFAEAVVDIQFRTWGLNILTQLKALLLFIKLFFVPAGFSFDHQSIEALSYFDPAGWIMAFVLVIFLILFVRANNRIKFGILWGVSFYFWRFYIQLESIARERHFYLTQIGIIFVLYVLLSRVKIRKHIFNPLLLIFLIGLGLVTYLRNPLYKNELIASCDIMERYPDSEIADFQIGTYFKAEKRYSAAEERFDRLILNARNPQLKVKALLNLVQIRIDEARYEEAEEIAVKALKEFPYANDVYSLLEIIYLKTGDFGFEELIKEYPDNAKLLFYGGDYLFRKGELSRARDYLNRSHSLGLDYPGYYFLLGRISELTGESDEAIDYYKKLLLVYPFHKEGCFYLGTILAQRGLKEAVFYLRRASKIDPEFAASYYNLGLYYLGCGDRMKAAVFINKARDLGYDIPKGIEVF
ncbi:MAG: tetratricopeptide repeat protein [Candidatus Kaelpia aquatica]|nr:tetratricopeptide repeat protein [Candidatus Kaelpia aquatica]